MSNTYKNINLDHDFGFSFTDDLSTEVETASSKASDAQAKAEAMYKAIMPLLNNLKKNPEKPNIYWPNRVEKVDEFIVKLKKILEG